MSITQILDGLLSGQQGTQAAPGAPQAGGLASLAEKVPGGLAGGLAAGGLLGVLVGNKKLRKKAGKFAGTVAGIGGAAALGVLAFKAYQNWQGGRPPSGPQDWGAGTVGGTPPLAAPVRKPSLANFDPATQLASDGQPFQLALVKAMIAAANADGHIDKDEQHAVFDALGRMELNAEDKALVFDTLRSSPSVETIAGYASGLEQASELYLVSRLAIDPDHPAEQAYLRDLAGQLGLPADLVTHLENQVEQPDLKAA